MSSKECTVEDLVTLGKEKKNRKDKQNVILQTGVEIRVGCKYLDPSAWISHTSYPLDALGNKVVWDFDTELGPDILTHT